MIYRALRRRLVRYYNRQIERLCAYGDECAIRNERRDQMRKIPGSPVADAIVTVYLYFLGALAAAVVALVFFSNSNPVNVPPWFV